MAQTESQYPHLYNQADKIEENRMATDLLYSIIMNSDSSGLNQCCIEFVKKIKKSHKNRSKRFDRMLDLCISDDNRVLKHSLIFFALQLEPWSVEYFLKDNKSDPKKISEFVSSELKNGVSQLLKGSYTSLQQFVEDARWRYVVL